MNIVSRFSKSALLSIVFLFTCLVILSAGTWSITRSNIQQDKLRNLPQDNLPKIQNITESFQVVSMERIEDYYVLRMKNTSNQAITHYTLVCPGGLVEGDFLIGDK